MEKLNKLLIQKSLKDNIGPMLNKEGFKNSSDFFVYEDELRFAFIGIRLIKRTYMNTQTFLLDPYIHVHVKSVEKIYKEITLNDFLDRKELLITIGNRLFELEPFITGHSSTTEIDYDFIPFSENDIDKVCKRVSEKIKQVALPYLERVESLEYIEILLNKHRFTSSIHMTNNVYRVVKGVIVAKLLQKDEKYMSSLINDYLIVARYFNPEGRKELQIAISI